jgi:hypothetical protein
VKRIGTSELITCDGQKQVLLVDRRMPEFSGFPAGQDP